MGLLSGLEKFGLSLKGELDITDESGESEDKSAAKQQEQKEAAAARKIDEKDLVLEKRVQCPVCDIKFPTLVVKSTKVRRLEPDDDLRPNFEGIDTLKYEVCSCPECGYSAMNKFFEHLSTAQMKWIKEAVSDKFSAAPASKKEIYTYDEAVDRYKLALVCAIAKKAKLSEKSLICLRISWLRRGQLKSLRDDKSIGIDKLREYQEEMIGFYRQAYEGFQKAISTETPPFCGMNSNTVEYLLANMAYNFKDYSVASKLVSNLIVNAGTPARVKDKCHDLKDKIVNDIKAAKKGE